MVFAVPDFERQGKARAESHGQHNIGMLLLLAVAVLYVNGALSVYGTNFMYLVRPPMEDLPYLNLEQGWYVYFLRLLLLGLGLVSLFHIPFILHQKNTDSRSTAC